MIVDEVLAVGDAEFQKKCLGKMDDVTKGEGRTVLFVSHNMGSIRQLCTSAMLLNNGCLVTQGTVNETLSVYLKSNIANGGLAMYKAAGPMAANIKFSEFSINDVINSEAVFSPAEPLVLALKYVCVKELPKFKSTINLYRDSVLIFTLQHKPWPAPLKVGDHLDTFLIPQNLLRPGNYTIGIGGHDGDPLSEGRDWLFINDAYSFTITNEWGELNDFSANGFINLANNIDARK